MTATDELCRMLAKMGVEYVLDEEYGKKYPPEQRVTWSCDIAGEDMTITARDYCIGRDESGEWEYCLDLEFHEVFTPEQAIAATVGDANLAAENQKLRELLADTLMQPRDYCQKYGIEYDSWDSANDHLDARMRELEVKVK